MRHIKTESKKCVWEFQMERDREKEKKPSLTVKRAREQQGHKSNDKDNVKKILNDSQTHLFHYVHRLRTSETNKRPYTFCNTMLWLSCLCNLQVDSFYLFYLFSFLSSFQRISKELLLTKSNSKSILSISIDKLPHLTHRNNEFPFLLSSFFQLIKHRAASQ